MVIFLVSAVVLAMAAICDAAGTYCLTNTTCNGHGYCSAVVGSCSSTRCICTGGYLGTFCTVPPVCTTGGNECGSHGSCNTGVFPYRCDCRDGYTGTVCTTAPICTAGGDECGNYGECNNCSSITNFCQCNSGYGGDTCNIAPVCTEGGNQCKNGGVCDFTQTPFNCTCLPGFSGDTCGASHVTFILTSLTLPIIWSLMNI